MHNKEEMCMSLQYAFGGAAALAVVLSLSTIAQATQGTVAEVQEDGRKLVLTTSDGKMTTVAMSGSRTKVTIGGQASTRAAIKAGMTCTATGTGSTDATALDCR
jgi:archaeosine-15-forming tRNA-guanine transglycosylase